MTLAVLPRQRARTPSSLAVREKHSTIPSYRLVRRPDYTMVNIFLIDKGLKYLDHFILILNEEFDSLDGGYSEWLA